MESKSIEADITGRVMALEQKLRGLQGRVSALEMRLSMETPGACQVSLYDGMEFISGEPSQQHTPDMSALEGRLSSMEAALQDKKAERADKKNLALDLTGLIVGLAMLAIGVLLSTGSFDVLRNPLLAFGAGIAILACVALRLTIK
ncbi:MAG TPA: hypothetical protein VGK13_02040 [Methanocellaceae archaeon]|jgi:hypothetical protein